MEDSDPPQTAPAEPTSVDDDTDYYDLEEVKARLMLPEDVLFSLVERFIESYGNIATNIATLVAEDKFKEAAEHAHSAKGVSGSLGATVLFEKCAEIEGMLKDERIDDLRAEMPGFVTIAERTIAVMKVALAKHKGA